MSQEKDPNWMQNLWRPMMGWMYMLICMADMMVFPVLWALWQGYNHQPITQWNPLTLQGAGLFHIAMGAVLGIAAFGRTQEKLAGTAANPTATSQTITNNQNMTGMNAGMGGGFGGMNNSGGFGGGMNNSGGFGGASSGGFGGQSSGGFGSAPSFGSTPAPSFGSAPATGGFGSTPSSTGGFSSGFAGTTPAPAVTPSVNASGQKVVPQATQPLL